MVCPQCLNVAVVVDVVDAVLLNPIEIVRWTMILYYGRKKKYCVQYLNEAIEMVVDHDDDDDGDDSFVDDDICFYDYLSCSMYEKLCDKDYKRHYLMVVDVVAPCDVLMSIWCLVVYRIHHIDDKLLMVREAIGVQFHYFQTNQHHHHYYN